MKIRDQVRAVVRERAGVTTDAVAAATGLKLQQCKDALNQMKSLGEMVTRGDGFAFNPEYVPLPRGAAARQRVKRLGKKVRGNRAELRARGVKRKVGRPAGSVKVRTEADVLRKHLAAPAPDRVPTIDLVKETAAALIAAVFGMDGERPSVLTHAARAHAMAMSLLD